MSRGTTIFGWLLLLLLAAMRRQLGDPGRREYGSGFQNLLPTSTPRVFYIEARWHLAGGR